VERNPLPRKAPIRPGAADPSGKSGAVLRRWWLLCVGIAIAAVALAALLRGGPARPIAAGPPPLDHIDDASRAQLDRVLREADRAGDAR
jgi:hypothetical protein